MREDTLRDERLEVVVRTVAQDVLQRMRPQ
jgi:hypothetical protein